MIICYITNNEISHNFAVKLLQCNVFLYCAPVFRKKLDMWPFYWLWTELYPTFSMWMDKVFLIWLAIPSHITNIFNHPPWPSLPDPIPCFGLHSPIWRPFPLHLSFCSCRGEETHLPPYTLTQGKETNVPFLHGASGTCRMLGCQ